MMIPTIKFEIRNFKTGEFATYLIENTALNYELVATHRYTRDIVVGETFSFQFEKEMNVPAFIVEYYDAMITEAVETFIDANRIAFEIDDVDEMVGMVI